MAAIVPTQALLETGVKIDVTLAEAVTLAGEFLSNRWTLAKADGTLGDSSAAYIALETGGLGTVISAVRVGARVDLGAVLAVGQAYFLYPGDGQIGLWSDLVSTNYVTFVGVAETTNILQFTSNVSGVQIP
jgi:hypothetical protein